MVIDVLYKLESHSYHITVVILSFSVFCFPSSLHNCNLTENSCAALATALSSNSCSLKNLNLSDNNLYDSGVQLLSAGLKKTQCKLETLK